MHKLSLYVECMKVFTSTFQQKLWLFKDLKKASGICLDQTSYKSTFKDSLFKARNSLDKILNYLKTAERVQFFFWKGTAENFFQVFKMTSFW